MHEYLFETLKLADVDCIKYSLNQALYNWHVSPAGQFCSENAIDLHYTSYDKDYLYFVEITGKMTKDHYLFYKLMQNQ